MEISTDSELEILVMNDLPDIDLELSEGGSNKEMRSTQRVVVAMSGGVDSSVAAALVKRAGYDTIGITLQLYDHGDATKRKGACCAGQDIHDARSVAASLDIPHYVLDYESLFRESVIDNFADTYLSGHTPIPCVKCNETVKFKDLLTTAKDLGAEALVTGHYIETSFNDGQWQMRRPVDEKRDQSYFLFSTTHEQLSFLRFPLAHLTKNEIREFAAKLALPVADKPDSQDICFVPNGDYASVIERLRPDCSLPGEIVDMYGNILGQHQGVLHYTVGQRRGLGVAIGEPLYVVRIDADTRQVIVGPKEALARRTIILDEVNWLGGERLSDPIDVKVKIRSTGSPVRANLTLLQGQRAEVSLDIPEEGVSPGQACVFYGAEEGPAARVLGGGWIISAQ
ncbi:1-deoxy-D-xylulose-5-phosphate synthase 2 protein [Candidatus Micropelagos thuwalensis]|uniref:tRNA-specific 2-thiouridylase MnmA n=1 Tax=Candidatus Micropelagius thuwalensis TaxID=1397666 RepID=U2WRI4_9PROT|nr:1-deoxy-D-xylulose-5-phosphate synthase 2 protein [Candidatus Micropelagos thuwalensis]